MPSQPWGARHTVQLLLTWYLFPQLLHLDQFEQPVCISTNL